MADGQITFSTELDNKDLEKQLSRLNSDIKKKTEKLTQMKEERLPLVEQSAQAAANLDRAKATLDHMRSGEEFFPSSSVGEQVQMVKDLQKEYDTVQSKVEGYDRKIQSAESALARTRDEAGEVSQQLNAAANSGSVMGDAVNRAQAYVEKFTLRVKKLAKRVFVFTVITGALRSVKSWLWQVIQTSDEAKAAMGQLKGALLTMAQPLAEAVIPLFTALVRILTAVISTIAQLIAYITGKPISRMQANAKALNAQSEAIDGVGESAKAASKYLAGFDELNVMDSSDTGGSGGGGSAGGVSPDFDFDATKTDSQLRNILALIEACAAGLLAWKFGNGFKDGLQKAIGYFLIIDGAIRTITSMLDAWNNGLSFDNLQGMLTGITEIVVGLYVALGPTAAAIGAVVGGIALLITGIKDAMDVGLNAQNMIAIITGMLVAGVGIAALTGSWIPLLIAGIAGLLLVVTSFFGDSEQLIDGLRSILTGFKDFFAGIFTGDITRSIKGIQEIFQGLKTVVFAIFGSIENLIMSFLDWLDEKTGGKLHGIIEAVKDWVATCFQSIRDIVGSTIDAIETIFGGIIKFVSGVFTGDWETAWEGVKDIFRGVWNGIVGVLGGAINIIIRALNWLIRQVNKISFDVPSWVPSIGGRHVGVNIPSIGEYQIPYLAQGAVIPPNREFMAVLGDQKRGTNIEAPADLIRQIVREELGNSGGTHVTIVLDSVDGKKLFDTVVRQNNAVVRATGASPLKV